MISPDPDRDHLWRLLAAIVLQAEGRVRVDHRALAEVQGAALRITPDRERGGYLLEYGPPTDACNDRGD